MPDIFKEVRVLRDEGKLHQKLLRRVRILLGISLILFVLVMFSVVRYGINPLFVATLSVGGFLFGFFLFSQMSPLLWNEEAEVVQMGRMDVFGYAILGLYVLMEISLRTALTDFLPSSAPSLILAAVFGLLFGRVMGMVKEIHRVYQASR